MTKIKVTVKGKKICFDNYLKATEVNFIKLLLNRSMIRKRPAQHLRFHVQGQDHIPRARSVITCKLLKQIYEKGCPMNDLD